MKDVSTRATIQAEGWREPIAASPDVIRAALFSVSSQHFSRFKIVRQDGWEFWGIYYNKKGWNMRTGTVHPIHELSAVRMGSKYSGKRLRLSFPWSLFARLEHFEMADVEKAATEFLEGASPPGLVEWVEVRRD
jgi:hypothetical protein